jgi:hypothetical protein
MKTDSGAARMETTWSPHLSATCVFLQAQGERPCWFLSSGQIPQSSHTQSNLGCIVEFASQHSGASLVADKTGFEKY